MVYFHKVHNAKDLFKEAAKSEKFNSTEKEVLKEIDAEFQKNHLYFKDNNLIGLPIVDKFVYHLKDRPDIRFLVEKREAEKLEDEGYELTRDK